MFCIDYNLQHILFKLYSHISTTSLFSLLFIPHFHLGSATIEKHILRLKSMIVNVLNFI